MPIDSAPVAGLLPARLASTRCPRKNLRPFGDTTLFEHALGRFKSSREITRLYVATHEPEFAPIVQRHPEVAWIERSERSARGEDLATIYDFLDSIEEPLIATINTCFPFLRVETFDRAIRYYREHRFASMIGAFECPGWFFSADRRRLVTPIEPGCINSKDLKPFWKASHAVFCWQKERAVEEGRMWSLQPDDPHLYPLGAEECIDIDTELEFELAEALFVKRRAAGVRW